MAGAFDPRRMTMVAAADALIGRDIRMSVAPRHAVLGSSMEPPFPPGVEVMLVGMGCFWGAERVFWSTAGVFSTAVGYSGGLTPNPTYEEVCTGLTGHAEVVLVAFDPARVPYGALLRTFWEGHDPTQGMRQGGDMGTQYRSLICVSSAAQRRAAEDSRDVYQRQLTKAGRGAITTEIVAAGPFYYAEDYHQQYLHKNPNGYCGHGGTGVSCPIALR